MKKTTGYGLLIAGGLVALAAWGQAARAGETGPEAVADALHAALADGDEERLRALLDPEVLVFEGGAVESSLQEYASHHMQADMAFMKNVERKVVNRNVFAGEKLAVVTTQARLGGTHRERTVELESLETLLLRRSDSGWKIRHVHWSNRSAD